MKRKFVSIILTAFMLIGMIPFGAIPSLAASELQVPTVAGSVLTSRNYTVSTDTTIIGEAGQSALVVSGDVVITINRGVTLTVRGGDANGTTGAGAGIEVPEGSSLTICGTGTLNATGGNAAVGSGGGAGVNGNVSYGQEWCYSGKGGDGGNGGGGAGAAIGGRGGNGGAGGAGGAGVDREAASSYVAYASGNNGSNGVNGSAGGSCGNITICKTVPVVTAGGTASDTPASGGTYGSKGMQEWYFYYLAFGGGGGGAGGNGYPAAAIGSGGAGGNGGGGGGSGIIIYWYSSNDVDATNGTGHGGCGGAGYGGNGGNGSDKGADSNTEDLSAGLGGNSGYAGGGAGIETTVRYLQDSAIPQPIQNLVYNGNTQTGVPAGTGYTLSESTAKNAGNYTAVATLCDGYCWADGTLGEKTFAWSIAKQSVSVPTSLSFCYTGREITAFADTALYTVQNGKATATGDYTATLTLKDANNYKWENVSGNAVNIDFNIHNYTDNGSGECAICGGTIRYVYNVAYLDKTVNDDNTVSTEQKTCAVARRISGDDTEWGVIGDTIWYVLDRDLSLTDRPTVKGDVRIILMNGKTLTANKGITVEGNNSLGIYAQSDDESVMGKLNIAVTERYCGNSYTAIGGSNVDYVETSYNGKNGKNGNNCGSVYFYGGGISLKNDGAVCIGGSNGGIGGAGNELYDGGAGGNGGNGGIGGNGGNVYFYGGNILLESTSAACIGGGNGGNGGNGGRGRKFTLMSEPAGPDKGGDGGGGNKGGNGGNVYFYAGNISVKSTNGVCIGGGNGGNGGNGGDGAPGNKGGDGAPGSNGGNSGSVHFYGGTVLFESANTTAIGGGLAGIGGIGGAGSPGGNGAGNGRSGSTDSNYWNLSGSPVIKAGETEQNAVDITAYNGEKYLSVHYHIWKFFNLAIHKCADCGEEKRHTDNGSGICVECKSEMCRHQNTAVSYQWNDAYDKCTAIEHCNDCDSDILTEESTDITYGETVLAEDCKHYEQTPVSAKFTNFGTAETVIYGDPGRHHYVNYICKDCGDKDTVGAKQDAIADINKVGQNSDAAISALVSAAKTTIENAETLADVLQLWDYWTAAINKQLSSVHEHTFSTEWSYNELTHWYESTCGHTVVDNFGAHTFGDDGKCTVCGYEDTGIRAKICTVILTSIDEPETVLYSGTTDGTNICSINNIANGTYLMSVSCEGAITRTYTTEITDGKVTQEVTLYEEGDVNGDGEITVEDYSAAVNAALGAETKVAQDLSETADYQKAVADIDKDGYVDVIDATLLERKLYC